MTLAIRTSPSGPLLDTIDPEVEALAGVAYVDRATPTPIAEQNGSINLPFSTLLAAINSLSATGGLLLVAPGDYTSEGALAFPVQNYGIIGLDPHSHYVYGGAGFSPIILPALTGQIGASINLVSVTGQGAISGFSAIKASACRFAAAISSSIFDGFDCRFLSSVGTLTVGAGLSITDSELDALTILNGGGITRLIDCTLVTSSAITFTGAAGSLVVDAHTAYFVATLPTTLTNGTLVNESSAGDAAMPANSLRGNPLGITGTETNIAISAGHVAGRSQSGGLVSLTGTEQGQNLRWSVVIDTATSGTVVSYSPTGYVSGTSNYIRCSPPANLTIRGMPIGAGCMLLFRIGRGTVNSVTLNHEDGAANAGEQFNCPDNLPYEMRAGDACLIVNSESRNNIIAIGTNPPTAITLSVAVPAVAVAGTLAYLDVSLVGTALEGTTANRPVIAAPQADLAAAGAGAGYYVGGRMSATNTFRMAFVGILAGGATNFTITRVG